MRKSVLASAVITAAVVAGVVSVSAASQAAVPSAATSKTLIFHVVFSPHFLVESNTDNPEASPAALGDMVVFHDQLFSHGQHVGDTVGSCVVAGLAPNFPNNCSAVFQVPGGDITAQFTTAPGPGGKQIALTGGTGTYRNAGGEGTLVEFGNGTGSLTLHVLSLVPRGGGA